MRLAVACVAAIALSAWLAPVAAGDWTPVGDSANPLAALTAAEIDGSMHVAYVGEGGELRVRRLSGDGTQWATFGGVVTGSAGNTPALLDTPDGPYVAWNTYTPGTPAELHVARYDAGTDSWVEPHPGSLNVDTGGNANGQPALALLDGVVHVAWSELSPGTTDGWHVYVKRLAQTGWEQPVAGPLNVDPAHLADLPHLAVSGGKLLVAFHELTETGGSSDSQIVVKRLDGGAWQAPAPSPTADPALEPSVAGLVDVGGVPYLAYTEDRPGGARAVLVKRLDDTPAWQSVGGELQLSPGSLATEATIASVGGVPYVGWGDRPNDQQRVNIHVKRLTASGDGWEEPVSGSLNENPQQHAFSLALAGAAGVPYAAWVEERLGFGPPVLIAKRLDPDVAPASVDFGSRPLGSLSDPEHVTFTNTESKDVHFPADAVTVTGADATDFEVLTDSCSGATVARGGGCGVDVRFRPAAAGDREAVLRLTSDAPGTQRAEVSGRGTGTAGPPPPPGRPGISINSGARYTNDPDVSIDVVWAFGANSLLLSNDGGFAGTSPQPLAAAVPWRLDESGSERLPKTVYARFDEDATTFTDDIILDQTAPTVASASARPRSRRVYRIRLSARDRTSGVSRVQMTSNRRHPGKLHLYRRAIDHRSRTGRIYVRVRDRAHNFSHWRRVKVRAR